MIAVTAPAVPRWIDFRAVKDAVSLEQVLVHYGVSLSFRGDALVGRCPLHKGVRNGNAFHVSPGRNAWKCFGDCRAGGNQLDFVMRMEGVDRRQAAALIIHWFGLDAPRGPSPTGRGGEALPRDVSRRPSLMQGNQTLQFTLQLDPHHPYLAARGLSTETVAAFGLGFCQRGLLAGRIAVPLHDGTGRRVGYAGRAVDSSTAEMGGKYRFPSGFKKSQVLFNLHRAAPLALARGLVVVEGFFSAFHLHQAGVPNVVALMGTQMSEEQERQLVEAVGFAGQVALMLDRDEAGRAGTADLVQRLIARTHVRVVPYETRQPDELPPARLRELLNVRPTTLKAAASFR